MRFNRGAGGMAGKLAKHAPAFGVGVIVGIGLYLIPGLGEAMWKMVLGIKDKLGGKK